MIKGRRVLAVVLALCIVIGVCPVSKEKVQAAILGDYEYEILPDGTIEITKYKGYSTGSGVVPHKAVIPGEINGRQVTSIGEKAFYACSLEEIQIPEGVTSIGEFAFYYCTDLKEIQIPEGVTSIGKTAFAFCTDLREVIFPSSLTSIGSFAFSNCVSLIEIRLPVGLTNIEVGTFSGCRGLTRISFPEGVTSIQSMAFCKCTDLIELSFPIALINIEDDAFEDCANITNIYYAGTTEQWNTIDILDEGNEAIFNAAIHCSNGILQKGYEYTILDDETIEIKKYKGIDAIVEIPAQIDGRSVTRIGSNAFLDQTDITEIKISVGVTSIGNRAFEGCTNLIKISIPDGVDSIEGAAFYGCIGLIEVTLPESVQSIGAGAFYGCKNLIEISIPRDVNKIENSVLGNCTSLKEISIPEGVTIIEDLAFDGCTGLERIDIPDSVNSILDHAFCKCSNLTDVYFSGTEEQWNEIEIDTYGNDELLAAKIHFYEDNDQTQEYETEDYRYKIMSGDTVQIIKYKGLDTEVRIPTKLDEKQVISIGGSAFKDCKGIIKVKIPASVSSIKGFAFSGCTGLTEINIPNGISVIENETFAGCKSLEKISIPSSVTSIMFGAFDGCINMREINIPNSVVNIEAYAFCNTGIRKISIPSGISNISVYTFAGCVDLIEISIPNSIINIGTVAFQNCRNLKDIYYSDTREKWNNIVIDLEGNEYLLNATIHCKDDQPISVPDEIILPAIVDPKRELENLKYGNLLSIEKEFQHFLSDEQIDIIESYLYTWLAEINFAHQYFESNNVKERIMKKTGIDPQGDFASGMEQAVTHICVETKYGSKTFEITLDLGKPDDNGNLYPSYGAMHYEILEKESIPSDLPKSGQIGRESYADLGTFAECVRKAAEDSLHGTYQWETLDNEMTAGVLVDKTVTEIIGNKNGSFSDAVFTIYAKPLFTYSKKVTIACPVDVHVYSMDGKEAGSIVGNKPDGGNANVRLDVNGDTKTVYLAGNDYYLNLRGTDTGTMRYEVEEIANEEVRRNVQFLELQLEKDMQYEGYVFRPLNIDRDLYALRTVGGSEQKVFYADKDTYQALFRRIQSLSLSQGQTSLDRDKTVQLQASLFPLDASNPNLQWITDNESIIKVDNNGLVTAVGAGRATVTVTTKDGSFLKQYCVIDVAEENHGFGGFGSSSGSSGWYGGSTSVPVEQEKVPVVVNLHYVLQFHANGGTGLSRRTMTLLADDSPGIMPKVKRKDYVFNGWYTQQDGGTQVTGDKPLKEAATLYARWTKAAAPAKAAAPTMKSKKKGQIQVSFQKVTGAAGYQIAYSESKQFTSAKTKEAGASAKTKTISGLKAGKKYYVRIRAYSLDSMKNRIYGAYSAVKSVKVEG